jgi:hypothetical protein
MAGLRDALTYLNDTPDEDFEAVIADARVNRENKAFKARLPPRLADIASRIRVIRPKKTTTASATGGAYGSSFTVNMNEVHFSVRLTQGTDKELALMLSNWSIDISAETGSETVSVTVKYGIEPEGLATASSSEYGDPGVGSYDANHGGMLNVLKALLDDLEVGDRMNEVEILQLLLGDDGEGALDIMFQNTRPSLKQIIMERLDHYEEG